MTPPRHRQPVTPLPIRRRRAAAGVIIGVVALSSGIGAARQLTATGSADGRLAGADPLATTAAASAAKSPATAEIQPRSADPVPSQATAAVVESGPGTLHMAALTGKPAPTGRAITLGLDIEDRMGTNDAQLAQTISRALLDTKGWQGVDHVRFVFVTPAQRKAGTKPDAIVTVASPKTVDKLCSPADTHGNLSCANNGRAVINYKRWLQGVKFYGKDLAGYRDYVVNHEVGHIIGHGHAKCPGKGKPAPVMLQQTLGLQGCTAWPWPKQP